ncbi:MAG TPA: SDR family oxidoreductase [Thermoplasmata archaeon]|nr:SDR family oxidoreductase [Thermoplasmata archaeon]
MSAATPPVALVTGASSGIGRATALLLARSGYRVFATVRSDAGERSLAAGIGTLPVEILRLDLADEAGVSQVARTVTQRAGRIDLLVNNAGYAKLGAVEDLPRAALRHQFEVNVFGAIQLCREVLPKMRAQGSGRIVNVSSLAGKVSVPLTGAYCASKFALEAFSDALRAEVKPAGIRVILVEPGPVATNFNRLARDESRAVLESPSVFRAAYERLRHPAAERGAASPERVARVILRTARARHPRSRYRVRVRETLEAGAVSVIPRGALDWIMIRFMGGRGARQT